jgi:hypothetical protein
MPALTRPAVRTAASAGASLATRSSGVASAVARAKRAGEGPSGTAGAREAGEALDLGHEARRPCRRVHRLDESLAIEARRDRLRDALAVCHAHDTERLAQLHVLPELPAREPRAPTLRRAQVQLRLRLPGGAEDVPGEREQRVRTHDARDG